MKGWRSAQHVPAAIVALTLAAFIVWARRDPVDLLEIELTQRVRPGQMITERAALIRVRDDCRSVVSAEIVDSQRIVHRVEPVDTRPPVSTGEATIDRNYPIPFSAAWGPARLAVQRTYYCWPFYRWWPIVNPRREMSFEIMRPDGL